jgi:hypothetical protein
MVKISRSSSGPSWRRMKTTHLGEKTSLPLKKEPIPSPLRKTRWQVPSFLAGHWTKLPTAPKKLKTMTALLATVAGTTSTAAAIAVAAALALLRRPNAVRLLACTGGRP